MQLFSLDATGSRFQVFLENRFGDFTYVNTYIYIKEGKRKQKRTEYPLYSMRELGKVSCRTVTSHSLWQHVQSRLSHRTHTQNNYGIKPTKRSTSVWRNRFIYIEILQAKAVLLKISFLILNQLKVTTKTFPFSFLPTNYHKGTQNLVSLVKASKNICKNTVSLQTKSS